MLVNYSSSSDSSRSSDEEGSHTRERDHSGRGRPYRRRSSAASKTNERDRADPSVDHVVPEKNKPKKRKLPPLTADLTFDKSATATPETRSPGPEIVPGEWLTHVFVEVPLDGTLRGALEDAISHVQRSVPSLVPLAVSSSSALPWTSSGSSASAAHRPQKVRKAERAEEAEETADDCSKPASTVSKALAGQETEGERGGSLHVSLSRPILLRAHQREDFWKEVEWRLVGGRFRTFDIAFASFTHLVNDDATKDFLVLEVGAGWNELLALSRALDDPVRTIFRQKPYYDQARFHSSIAWVSLLPPTLAQASMPSRADVANTGGGSGECGGAVGPEAGTDERPGVRTASSVTRLCDGDGREELGSSEEPLSSLPNEKAPPPPPPPPHSHVGPTPPKSPLAPFIPSLDVLYASRMRSARIRVSRVGVRIGKRVRWVSLA